MGKQWSSPTPSHLPASDARDSEQSNVQWDSPSSGSDRLQEALVHLLNLSVPQAVQERPDVRASGSRGISSHHIGSDTRQAK